MEALPLYDWHLDVMGGSACVAEYGSLATKERYYERVV